MRKLLAVAALAVAMIVGSASPSQAVAISFAPSNQTTTVGGNVSVDLVISGLGVAGALGLGAFDLDITLSNPAIVSHPPNNYTLTSYLGAIGSEAEDFSTGWSGVTLNLQVLSYLTPGQLLALQGPTNGTFTLATLTFTGASIGTTFLNVTRNVLGNEDGTVTYQPTLSQGQINVAGPTTVPEPGTLPVAGLGLAMFIRKRARRSAS